MTQHSLDYYMSETEIFHIKENNMKEKENNVEEKIEQINDLNGIIEIKYGNETYKIWKVEFIRPFIYKFLKDKYPNSLIAREINKIDITLFNHDLSEIIPIEIQKTPIMNKEYFCYGEFEDKIQRQLKINISNYNICWFFFDYEYLRRLKSGNINKSNINLIWIIELMKENTLKTFAIRYDGFVQELTIKDFDFLKDVSKACSIGKDNDERILNKNKLCIYYNVIQGYKFTQEEITQFENEFDNRVEKKYVDSSDYFINNDDKRYKLYGHVLHALWELPSINYVMSCMAENKPKRTVDGVALGLFLQNDFHGSHKNATIQFIDKFNIAQYFPGYIRNKQMWDYCKLKQRIFTLSEFRGIVEGTFNYEFIKKQSIMLDY